jgi:hypothetical protein
LAWGRNGVASTRGAGTLSLFLPVGMAEGAAARGQQEAKDVFVMSAEEMARCVQSLAEYAGEQERAIADLARLRKETQALGVKLGKIEKAIDIVDRAKELGCVTFVERYCRRRSRGDAQG